MPAGACGFVDWIADPTFRGAAREAGAPQPTTTEATEATATHIAAHNPSDTARIRNSEARQPRRGASRSVDLSDDEIDLAAIPASIGVSLPVICSARPSRPDFGRAAGQSGDFARSASSARPRQRQDAVLRKCCASRARCYQCPAARSLRGARLGSSETCGSLPAPANVFAVAPSLREPSSSWAPLS